MERISFYIPAYNAQNTISYALDSLLRQTYKIDEIIVIDDNSIDGSRKILEKIHIGKIDQLILNEKNYGKGYSVRKGIEKVKW